MNYLLDTHSLFWSLVTPNKLSQTVKDILSGSENAYYVSVISFWEISLKYSLGKLDLAGTTPEKLLDRSKQAGFEILNLFAEEASSFHNLPRYNKDPFDRMLAWQAINRNLVLLSADTGFDDYEKQGLKRIW